MNASSGRVFVIRVWSESREDSGAGVWRATVVSPGQAERRSFADPAALVAYLLEEAIRVEHFDTL